MVTPVDHKKTGLPAQQDDEEEVQVLVRPVRRVEALEAGGARRGAVCGLCAATSHVCG